MQPPVGMTSGRSSLSRKVYLLVSYVPSARYEASLVSYSSCRELCAAMHLPLDGVDRSSGDRRLDLMGRKRDSLTCLADVAGELACVGAGSHSRRLSISHRPETLPSRIRKENRNWQFLVYPLNPTVLEELEEYFHLWRHCPRVSRLLECNVPHRRHVSCLLLAGRLTGHKCLCSPHHMRHLLPHLAPLHLIVKHWRWLRRTVSKTIRIVS